MDSPTSPVSPANSDESELATIESLPDSLILNVLNYLTPFEVARVHQCSQRLSRVCSDEILWRRLFHRYFCLQPIFANPIGYKSWREEFIRLLDEIPIVEAQVLTDHTDQVLHVSHSHDGEVFATTSKDAYVHVWNSTHPVTLKYSHDMKQYSWKYTQFSQFNESDTLLLVSGVLFGLQSTSGEIVVFSLKGEFELQCRVKNKPYDIFGSWYSETYLFSGALHWLGHLVSKSILWLNKASQEVESEHTAVMNQMYRFYNPKASSVRSILVANCVDAPQAPETSQSSEEQPTSSRYVKLQTSGNPPSFLHCRSQSLPAESDLISINSRGCKGTLQGAFQNWKPLNNIADINYTSEYRSKQLKERAEALTTTNQKRSERSSPKRFKSTDEESESESREENQRSVGLEEDFENKMEVEGESKETNSPVMSPMQDDAPSSPSDSSSSSSSSESAAGGDVGGSDFRRAAPIESETDEIIDLRDKWLIFTCGSKTYTPHQIGFKRIRPFKFKSLLDPGPSLLERYAELRRRANLAASGQPVEEPVDYTDYDSVADRFDAVDHIIDLHGHIIGMTVSPDHRYLYVNSRPWPGNYTISDPLDPPPIAQEIDIHVIDLTTLRQVGMMRRAHRAYTPNEECFFIFLDASNFYLASGAEDKHAYMWERNYGISLAKLPHADVVNSVAFSSQNPEMLISVSDDHTVKIWRSRRQCRELGIDMRGLTAGVKLYLTPRPTYATAAVPVTK